jgi:hypothetical protein
MSASSAFVLLVGEAGEAEAGTGKGGDDRAVAFRASTRPKNSESERNLSPNETNDFASWS